MSIYDISVYSYVNLRHFCILICQSTTFMYTHMSIYDISAYSYVNLRHFCILICQSTTFLYTHMSIYDISVHSCVNLRYFSTFSRNKSGINLKQVFYINILNLLVQVAWISPYDLFLFSYFWNNIFLRIYKQDYLECGSLNLATSPYTGTCSSASENTQHFPKLHSRLHPNISATQNSTLLRTRSPYM
jgi:hypothetical protein